MPPPIENNSTDSPTGVGSSAVHLETGKPHIKRSTFTLVFHYGCYILHGLLLIIQIVLLAMLWSHPERNVTIAFDNNVLTIGLSAFLQAFYTASDTRGAKHISHNVCSSIRRYWSSSHNDSP